MERTVVVGEDEDGLGGDGGLEGVKSALLCASSGPSYIFSGEVKQRPRVMGEVLDEPPIEVGEPQEGLYLLLVPGLRPLGHAGHLTGSISAIPCEMISPRFEVELVQAETVQDNSGDATMLL
ncbi:hypothetical protein C0992_001608 [Termitomyces sp. T32_za158]|nr:hypothetical protein C0992_001608 [Termitomyces sp. T32_za158]